MARGASVTRMHGTAGARRYWRAVTASDVRAHTTIGAAFKGIASRDEGLKPT